MKRMLPAMTAVVVVLVTGLVHGFWTDRWGGSSEEVQKAADSLKNVPEVVGDWEGHEVPAPRDSEGLAGQRYVNYVDRRTGDAVMVALVCGRPGPVAIHTPDVCYGASGYSVTNMTRHAVSWPGGPSNFFTMEVEKTSQTDKTQLRVFWSWFAAGRWEVSDNPRLAFARQPAIYKLYVIRDMVNRCELDEDPCLRFLRQLLPELQKGLVSPP